MSNIKNNFKGEREDSFIKARAFLQTVAQTDGCLDCTEARPFRNAPSIDSRFNIIRRLVHIIFNKEDERISEYSSPSQINAFKCASLGYFLNHGLERTKDQNHNVQNIITHTSTFKIIENALRSLNSDNKYTPTILVPVPTFGLYLDHIPENYEQSFFDSDSADFNINAEKLSEHIRKTKPDVLLLQNPINPSGQVLTNVELKKIAEACNKSGTFVICDEIFSEIINTGGKIDSMCKYMEPEQVLVTHGLGKSYGMVGARSCIAYSGNEELVQKLNYDNPCGDISGDVIRLSTKWLKEKRQNERENYKDKNTEIFKTSLEKIAKKIESINSKLCKIYGGKEAYIKLVEPESTNVALLDFSALRNKEFLGQKAKTGNDVAQAIFEVANVGFVPGEAFMLKKDSMCLRITLSPKTPVLDSLDAINNSIKKQLSPSEREGKFTTMNESRKRYNFIEAFSGCGRLYYF